MVSESTCLEFRDPFLRLAGILSIRSACRKTNSWMVPILKKLYGWVGRLQLLTQTRHTLWWPEFTKKIYNASMDCLQPSKIESTLRANHSSASENTAATFDKTPFCWLFNSWRTTTTPLFSVTILTEFPTSQDLSPHQGPRLMEKLELFENLFQTNLKIHARLTEDHGVSFFTPPCGVFRCRRRKNVKSQSRAMAKQKLHKLVFNTEDPLLVKFFDEFQTFERNSIEMATDAIIEQFMYDKGPPQLKNF